LRGEFAESRAVETSGAGGALFAGREAERCLGCDSACLRCVEVCPNRANFALPVQRGGSPVHYDGGFTQSIQILHVDALCNECGNCGIFCPYEGEPYRGKPSLFKDRAALDASQNAGIAFIGGGREPSLILREAMGGPTRSLSYDQWSRDAEGVPMTALARAVHRDHTYLIGGSR
jgi:putative selenate reductase